MHQTPSPCPRCERLPTPISGSGRLFLWAPLGHSADKAALRLRAAGFAPGLDAASRLAVPVEEAEIAAVGSLLADVFTPEEMRATRALFLEGDREPAVSDIPRIATLDRFMAELRAGWLIDLLREERFLTQFQPIVEAAHPEHVFGFEALLRGVSPGGELIPPKTMFRLAEEADLLFQLDRAARRSAVAAAAQAGLAGRLFVNFTPAAVYDPEFCLGSTVAAVREQGLDPARFVFEVTESERTASLDHLKAVLAFCRKAGFKVALDDLGEGYSSLNLIHEIRPDLVKLDMKLVRDVDRDPVKAVITRNLLDICLALRIPSVLEGVETEGELAWARRNGAAYVQGFLTGQPRSMAEAA